MSKPSPCALRISPQARAVASTAVCSTTFVATAVLQLFAHAEERLGDLTGLVMEI